MVTACFNSVAFQTKEITSILEKYDIKVSSLLVDGGMVKNKTFCQILANSLEKEILQPQNVESTALGACIVAMASSGNDLNNIIASDMDIFKPNVENTISIKKSYDEWKSYLIHTMRPK